MIGAILAVGQKLLPNIIGTIVDSCNNASVEKQRIESEASLRTIEIQEQTKQLELNKEIAEKGLQTQITTLQTEQEKTKQAQVQASQSTYNTFAENVTKQTQYNINKLSEETNNYIARFRPDHTNKVFDTLILFARYSFIYYGVVFLAYCVICLATLNVPTDINFTMSWIFPVPSNIFTAIILFPLWILYLIYEQWGYMQTYWFISRDEEKQRMGQKKK